MTRKCKRRPKKSKVKDVSLKLRSNAISCLEIWCQVVMAYKGKQNGRSFNYSVLLIFVTSQANSSANSPLYLNKFALLEITFLITLLVFAVRYLHNFISFSHLRLRPDLVFAYQCPDCTQSTLSLRRSQGSKVAPQCLSLMAAPPTPGHLPWNSRQNKVAWPVRRTGRGSAQPAMFSPSGPIVISLAKRRATDTAAYYGLGTATTEVK